MIFKKSLGEKAFDAFNLLFLALLMMVCVYPIWYILSASFSKLSNLSSHEGFIFYPLGFSLESYKVMFQKNTIFVGYYNTIIYVVAGTFINLTLTFIGAYCFSRKNVMLQKPLLFLILFTMFFSGGLIPRYLLVKDIGLRDTRWAILLPTAISTYNLIIMRSSIMGIPISLEESAKIDGASHFRIMYRIILPLSMPIIAVMTLFYGVYRWNDWFQAFLYIQGRALYPLQLFLREILISNDIENTMGTALDNVDGIALADNLKYCTIIIATLPILILYPFLQKYFTKGIMVGAIKG